MITKEQIINIARDELTPIGWHEEHAKYIDGLDAFSERLVKLCNISHVMPSLPDGLDDDSNCDHNFKLGWIACWKALTGNDIYE